MLTRNFSLPLSAYQFPHPPAPCSAHDSPGVALLTYDRKQHYPACESCLRAAGLDPNCEAELLCESRPDAVAAP